MKLPHEKKIAKHLQLYKNMLQPEYAFRVCFEMRMLIKIVSYKIACLLSQQKHFYLSLFDGAVINMIVAS